VSKSNVEVLRRWVEVCNARDIEAMVEYFDPGLELHSAFAAVGGGVYRGLVSSSTVAGSGRTPPATPSG
jgi:hypothetical protein